MRKSRFASRTLGFTAIAHRASPLPISLYVADAESHAITTITTYKLTPRSHRIFQRREIGSFLFPPHNISGRLMPSTTGDTRIRRQDTTPAGHNTERWARVFSFAGHDGTRPRAPSARQLP